MRVKVKSPCSLGKRVKDGVYIGKRRPGVDYAILLSKKRVQGWFRERHLPVRPFQHAFEGPPSTSANSVWGPFKRFFTALLRRRYGALTAQLRSPFAFLWSRFASLCPLRTAADVQQSQTLSPRRTQRGTAATKGRKSFHAEARRTRRKGETNSTVPVSRLIPSCVQDDRLFVV